MKIRRIVNRRIRRTGSGIDLAADVNAALSVNVEESGARTEASSRRTAVSDTSFRGDDAARTRGKESE